MELLEKAKDLINQFYLDEYGSEADFSDLSHIDVAYTETESGKRIQIVVNLVDYRLEVYKGNRLTSVYGYNSLEEITENELEWLNYDELISM